mgnify:CR=1 FL=1
MINNFNELKLLLNQSKPFSIIRFGNVEMSAILQDKGIYNQMYSNAGFYGNEKVLYIIAILYLMSIVANHFQYKLTYCTN